MSSASRIRRFGSRHRAFGGAGVVTYYSSDAMGGADGTTLALHVPVAVGAAPAGIGWTEVNGPSPTVQLLGNRAINNTAVNGGHRLALDAAGVTPTDQSVLCDIKFFTNLGGSAQEGFIARMTGGGAGVGGYHLTYVQTGVPFFRLDRIDDGFAGTQIGGNYLYPFPAFGTVAACEIRCVGGNISAIVDGVTIIAGVDGAPLTGTKGGLYFSANGVSATAAATGVHFDNLVVRSPS